MFSEKLKSAMQELNLNQKNVCELTGRSKGSVSQYLSGKQIPNEETQIDIAVSLGLPRNYFYEEKKTQEQACILPVTEHVQRMRLDVAAKMLGLHPETVRKGLQQGVFPWGYGIHTSDNRWVYFINAKRFAEIEGVSVCIG